jgi:hypothetical protein
MPEILVVAYDIRGLPDSVLSSNTQAVLRGRPSLPNDERADAIIALGGLGPPGLWRGARPRLATPEVGRTDTGDGDPSVRTASRRREVPVLGRSGSAERFHAGTSMEPAVRDGKVGGRWYS